MSQDGSNRHYRTFKLVFCLSQSSTRVIDDCTVWKVKRIAFTRAPFSMCLFNIERWLASIFVICESYWCTLILFMAEYWAKISELFDFSLMALDPLGFGLLMERSIHQRETIKQQTRKGKTKKKKFLKFEFVSDRNLSAAPSHRWVWKWILYRSEVSF